MKRLILLLLAPFALGLSQGAPAAPARAAIDKIAWIEGDWTGPAWYAMGPRRSNVNQSEKIYRAAGGTVLVIHGLGTLADPNVPPNTVVHDAFAVVTWDAQRGYVLRSYLANGNSLETILEVGDRKMVWGFDSPQMGKARYTVTLTPAGEWFEIGERSDDGATWTKFVEMTLRKK